MAARVSEETAVFHPGGTFCQSFCLLLFVFSIMEEFKENKSIRFIP